MKVLLAEDETLESMLLRMRLVASGHQVLPFVVTGDAAVRAAMEQEPDVVVMDVRLAEESDGIRAACEIRKATRARVIFLTGFDDHETRARAAEASPHAYLVKPVAPEAVVAAIDSIKASERSGASAT